MKSLYDPCIGRVLLSTVMLLLSWGWIVPTHAVDIVFPGPLTGDPVNPVYYFGNDDKLNGNLPANATDDSINQRDLVNLDLVNNTNFTLAFTLAVCVNSVTQYNSGASSAFITKRGISNGYFFGIDGKSSGAGKNGTVKFRNETTGSAVRSNGVLIKNTTYSVVVVYRTNGRVEIYINGQLNNTGNIGAFKPTTKPLVIGRENVDRIKNHSPPQPHGFHGTLSNIEIDDEAWDEEAIAAHNAECHSRFELTVNPSNGGTVTGQGINCGNDCTEDYEEGTQVTLRAMPTPGHVFAGWSGACTGTTTTCQVTMNQARTVTATFNQLFTLNVEVTTGINTGTVTGQGINCGNDCTEDYEEGTQVILTATAQFTDDDDPNNDFVFGGWDGCPFVVENTCQVTMNQARTVRARFTPSVSLNEEGFACFTGNGQGVSFSWALREGNTIVASNSNAITTEGDPARKIATRFITDEIFDVGGIDLPNTNNCIKLADDTTTYTLFINGQEVTDTPMTFNPTIRWVSKTQMLTSITGFVWNDLNGNRSQGLGESYLPEWAVILKKPNGEETATVSNADGYYEFIGLSDGTYTVAIETRTGATYTTAQSVTRTVDSVKIPTLADFGIGKIGIKDEIDGNNDSIPDSVQANVVSLPNATNGHYLTLEALPATCTLENVHVEAESSYPVEDAKHNYPYGLVGFEVNCSQADLTVFYHNAVDNLAKNAYRKYGPTIPGDEQSTTWYSLPKVAFDFVTIGGQPALTAKFSLTDGQLGDDTGVDGRIVDDGGLAEKVILSELVSFSLQGNTFTWETATELNTIGYYLWQAKPDNGDCQNYSAYSDVTRFEGFISAEGSIYEGASYNLEIPDVKPDHCYGLEEVDSAGGHTFYIIGPNIVEKWLELSF